METERQYVKDLESLTRDYLKPLRRLNLLSGTQLEEIFSNIEQVIDCNTELLAEFEKQKKVSSLLVGDVGKSFHARVRCRRAFRGGDRQPISPPSRASCTRSTQSTAPTSPPPPPHSRSSDLRTPTSIRQLRSAHLPLVW